MVVFRLESQLTTTYAKESAALAKIKHLEQDLSSRKDRIKELKVEEKVERHARQ